MRSSGAFKIDTDNTFQALVSAINKRKHSKELGDDGSGIGSFFSVGWPEKPSLRRDCLNGD